MGIFERLFGKTAPSVAIKVQMREEEPNPDDYHIFSGKIAGFPIKAEVPFEAKAECERLFRKSNRSYEENEYLYFNYWVNVYYKGERHGYHGVNDVWTYPIRSLPEFPLIHEWIYSILGKKKPEIKGNINTVKKWENKGSIYVLGKYSSMNIQVSFKPRGYVLKFLIKDELRWEDKASYNTKTGQANFHFYYSNAQGKIIDWAKAIFIENTLKA